MASFTSFLNLLKKNPATDGKDTFNIETMLNENWDKIDLKVEENSSAIGQKADKTQISNPNLLINPDFPVWQRGTSFGSGVYSADRWIAFSATGGVQVTKDTDNSLKISSSKAEFAGITQAVEGKYRDLLGKKVTLSAKVKSTIPIFLSVEANGTTVDSATFSASADYTVISKTVTLPASINENTLRALVVGNQQIGTINVAWVKLELGDIATPFSPRSYAEELAMCQRYCITGVLLGLPYLREVDNIWFQIDLPATMRRTPTLIFGDMNIYVSGVAQSGFAFHSITEETNGIRLRALKTSHGLSSNLNVNIYSSSAILDAEIY